MGVESQNIPVLKPGIDMARSSDPQPELDETGRKLYEDARNSIVKIVSDKDKTGTGFLIEDGSKLITTARAVLDSREHFAVGPDGKRYKAEIEKLDDLHDLAVLRLQKGAIAGTKALELGSSKELEEDQKLYTFSIPTKANDAYVSPGYGRGIMSPIQLLATMDPNIGRKLMMKGFTMDMQEQMEARAMLGRPLFETKTHIQRGGGGGPMLDESGKVVAITQLSNGVDATLGKTLSSPVEAAQMLLDKGGKFDVSYKASAEPWAEEFKKTVADNKMVAAGSALVVGGMGYAGYLGLNRYPLIGGGALAGHGLMKFTSDATNFLSSSDSKDSLKYGLASAADLSTFAGGVMTFVPKVRGIGMILAAGGIAGRAATDFIQNHWVVDEFKRKDGSARPPASFDKLIGS
ncbi:MAG: serine protease [Candidatus Obscuribacterales bacterium]|jgi:hypothetical protein|nr:serine protease [Candidatus Obscuribacterales bacterium]